MNLSKIISTLTFQDVTKQNISGLDGLRGFAVLFVLGAHTKFFSQGFGATGVWIFFLLSGYLLSNNLIIDYTKSNKSFFATTIQFYVKRFFRIVPVYFIVLLFYCFIVWGGNVNLLIKHYTFQEAIWLFWTIKTELLFYILLPLILISMLALTKKQNNLIFISILLILFGYYLTEYKIIFTLSLAKVGQDWPFYLTPFLVGIFITFIKLDLESILRIFLFYFSFIIVLILTIDTPLTLELRTLFYQDGIRLPWRDRIIVYIFVSILVITSINSNFFLLENRFIKTLGTVSFSFYLWHTLILVLLRKSFNLSGIELFLASFPIIFIISVFSYHLVEIKFHSLGKTLIRNIDIYKQKEKHNAL